MWIGMWMVGFLLAAMVVFPGLTPTRALDGMKPVGPCGGPLEELLPELPLTCIVGAAHSVKLTEPDASPRGQTKRDSPRES